jgi:thiosulfate reductase cytochrome b subunit
VILVIAALFAMYFFIVTIPAAPLSAVILPGLLALVYLGLRRQRGGADRRPLLESLPGKVTTWKYLSLLAIPATSTLVYALALELGIQVHTNQVWYFITTPLGFILFGYSLYRAWRSPAAPEEMG